MEQGHRHTGSFLKASVAFKSIWITPQVRSPGLLHTGSGAKLTLRSLEWDETRLTPKSDGSNCESALLVVQSLSHVWLLVTPWTAAHQASLSFTISWSLLKFMSIESVMPSNHLILCRPLLLLPSAFPSSWFFSSELVLHIRWPKYWSFNFSISPSNKYQGWFPLGRTGLDLLAVQGTLKTRRVTLSKLIHLLQPQFPREGVGVCLHVPVWVCLSRCLGWWKWLN